MSIIRTKRRRPQRQILRVESVTDDGDGDWTVMFHRGGWMTVKPQDVNGRRPEVGERYEVQCPMVIRWVTSCDPPGEGER